MSEDRDPNLDTLLDLDGQVLVVDPEGGHWVKFVVTRVPVSSEKPHGLDYSLTLHGPSGERLVGFDNAHPVDRGRRGEPMDHRHRLQTVKRYALRGCGHAIGRLLAGGGRGIERARRDMTTLKVGIADYEEMKARTMRIARGEEKPAAGDPKVWFTSTESFAKVLSAGNRELLRIIAEKAPASLEELAEITGRAASNLSRTLKTMETYGLVRFERGHGRKLAPRVVHDRVELALPLIGRIETRKAAGGGR